MTFWANCIVHNEENFIWFAIMSVVDYVDKILVWDTGSTDKTVEIIKEIKRIKGDKIVFKEVGQVDNLEFTKMRQAMLEQSKCDWILILDGDEIWDEVTIKGLVKIINSKGQNIDAIAVHFFNLLGDIYHYQDEEAGRYNIHGRKGNLPLKAINKKIPGLHVELPYGKEGFYDENGDPIQTRKKIYFLDGFYLHATHLQRSSLHQKYNKFKYELGHAFPKTFRFPKVFFANKPSIVADLPLSRSFWYMSRAGLETALKKIKRKIEN